MAFSATLFCAASTKASLAEGGRRKARRGAPADPTNPCLAQFAAGGNQKKAPTIDLLCRVGPKQSKAVIVDWATHWRTRVSGPEHVGRDKSCDLWVAKPVKGQVNRLMGVQRGQDCFRLGAGGLAQGVPSIHIAMGNKPRGRFKRFLSSRQLRWTKLHTSCNRTSLSTCLQCHGSIRRMSHRWVALCRSKLQPSQEKDLHHGDLGFPPGKLLHEKGGIHVCGLGGHLDLFI